MKNDKPSVRVEESRKVNPKDTGVGSTDRKAVGEAELVEAEPVQKKQRRRYRTWDEIVGGSGPLFGRR